MTADSIGPQDDVKAEQAESEKWAAAKHTSNGKKKKTRGRARRASQASEDPETTELEQSEEAKSGPRDVAVQAVKETIEKGESVGKSQDVLQPGIPQC
jgi:hypothetical protein